MTSDFTSSQQVSWLAVHRYAQPHLTRVGHWPMIGTTAWAQLERFDPAKWAAILDAAQHWALRIEGHQQARIDASHTLSTCTDWRADHQTNQAIAAFRAKQNGAAS